MIRPSLDGAPAARIVLTELTVKSSFRKKITHLSRVAKSLLDGIHKKNIAYKDSPGGAKIVSEYDQEIPQSQTADNPVAPRGRAAQPSQDTRKTN